MGLFQAAVKTYDAMSELVGVKETDKEILAPVGHVIARAKIEIVIDNDGNFIKASKIDEKVPIPCTEKSAGRSSSPAAHPLCDKLEYVSEADIQKHAVYMEEIKKWKESSYGSDKLDAIYAYLQKSHVLSDCKKSKVIDVSEKGEIKNLDDIVTWRVEGFGKNSGPIYEDKDLQKKYGQYYIQNSQVEGLCMVSGKTGSLAIQHLKGISNFASNAKLVSSNDDVNFTYRGRFMNDYEAMTMGYESSQKAHNALKWLLSNEGISLGDGGRRMVCWNPSGRKIPKFNMPLLKRSDADKIATPTHYKQKLQKVLMGYRSQLPETEGVVIAAFEAATSGRLSLTYYNELRGSDFLDRLYFWDSTCCWYNSQWGISSPSLVSIVNYAFGTRRDGQKEDTTQFKTEGRIFGSQMQRLISCRIDRAKFPIDIMRNIVSKTEKLQLYSDYDKNNLLFTVCAVIRKYRFDNLKEVWEMALEENRHDRSYQYGRLLAVMEKIERDTYDGDEKRETNAIRLQSFFIQRPQAAVSQIMTQLKTGYYPRISVGSRIYYDKLIGQIIENISEFGENEIGKSLSETYLMGYYLQKNALYTKKEQDNEEEN